MNISNLLIKYKAPYIVTTLTIIYWIFGLIVRFFPSVFMNLNEFWWSVYIQVTKIFITTNVLCIILLISMLFFKTWNLKYTLILLGINILTVIFGPYFIAFPIIIM